MPPEAIDPGGIPNLPDYNAVFEAFGTGMQNFAEKFGNTSKKVEQTFFSLNDVAQLLGNSSGSIIKYQEELKKLASLEKSLTNLSTKRLANGDKVLVAGKKMVSNLDLVRKSMQKLGEELTNIGVANAAAAVHIKNFWTQVSTGIPGEEKVSAFKSKMVNLFEGKISPAAEKITRFFGTDLTRKASQTTQGMLDFKGVLLKLTPMFMLGSFLASTFMRVLKGTVNVHRTLLGSMNSNQVSLLKSASLYSQMAVAGGIWNVKQEDQIKLLNALTSTYALSGDVYKQVGADGGAAAVTALAYGKAMNLSSASAMAAIVNFKLFGKTMFELPAAMNSIKTASNKTGLTVMDLTGIMNKLAPISLGARDATGKILDTFTAFGRAAKVSILEPFKDMSDAGRARNLRASAEAMKSFADAAASMKLPQTLAFGGGLGMGGATSLTQAFVNASNKTRAQMMIDMLRQVSKFITPGDDKIGQMATFMTQTMPNLNETTALKLAETWFQTEASRKAGQKESDSKGEKASQAQLAAFTGLASGVEDPLKRILGVIQDIFGWLITTGAKWAAVQNIGGMVWGGGRRR